MNKCLSVLLRKVVVNYWVASMANPVGIWVLFRLFFFNFIFYFSVSGKVLPVTPLPSSVFVHRVFSAYLLGLRGLG